MTNFSYPIFCAGECGICDFSCEKYYTTMDLIRNYKELLEAVKRMRQLYGFRMPDKHIEREKRNTEARVDRLIEEGEKLIRKYTKAHGE